MEERNSIIYRTLLLLACLLPVWGGDLQATESKKVFSIQVLSSRNQEDILSVARTLEKTVPGVRVEKLDALYVLRVGKYDDAKKGEATLREIRKTHRQSFIRTVYDIPERVIYGDQKKEDRIAATTAGVESAPAVVADVPEGGKKEGSAPLRSAETSLNAGNNASTGGSVGAAKQMTLQQSLAIALNKSVMIQSAREGVNIAEDAKKEAFTNFLPKLSTSYSYQRLNEQPQFQTPGMVLAFPAPINTITIPESITYTGTQDNYIWATEVKQPLFAGGANVANYQAQSKGEEIARVEEQTTIQDVTQEVKVSYFSVLKAQRLLDVARQSMDRLKSHWEMAKRFFEAGLTARNGLLTANVELANGEQSLVAAENGVELAKAKFNTVLRMPIDTPVQLEDVLEYHPYEKKLEACLNDALTNRPEIRSYALKAQQARKLVDVAKSEYYPSVNAVGHYEFYGDTPGVQGSAYKDRTSWYVMAVASWNVWEWGKTKNRVDASRSRENQINYALTNIREQTTLEVKNAWLSLREAEKRVMASKKTIEEAEENYLASRALYKEQMGTATEVLDAQTLLTKANSDYFNALGDYQIGLARLERVMGIP